VRRGSIDDGWVRVLHTTPFYAPPLTTQRRSTLIHDGATLFRVSRPRVAYNCQKNGLAVSARRFDALVNGQMADHSGVAVLGAGSVGLSAIQGARIQGAAKIIAIEPIRARRELALRLGATVALDPNVEGNGLVARVRELCQEAATRKLLGGRDRTASSDSGGADFVIATVARISRRQPWSAALIPPACSRRAKPGK